MGFDALVDRSGRPSHGQVVAEKSVLRGNSPSICDSESETCDSESETLVVNGASP